MVGSGNEYYELRNRIEALALQSADNVRDQHLVSQVILRRFARPVASRQGRRLLARINIRYPTAKVKLVGSDGCGKFPDFVRFASRSLEHIWSDVENRMPAALNSCDSGTVFQKRQQVDTIKDAIALHFVRSIQTLIVHERAWLNARAEHRDRWVRQRQILEQVHYDRWGLYPAGFEALERTIDELIAPAAEWADSGALFRARIESLFEKSRSFIRSAGLEILRPKIGEFVISDAPALALKRDRPGVGPLDGIALLDANAVVLPLAPRCVAVLGKADAFGEINGEWVERLNALQVMAAHRHVFFRPDDRTEAFVRQVASARQSRI